VLIIHSISINLTHPLLSFNLEVVWGVRAVDCHLVSFGVVAIPGMPHDTPRDKKPLCAYIGWRMGETPALVLCNSGVLGPSSRRGDGPDVFFVSCAQIGGTPL